MKAIKLLLFGISLILVGIFGAIFFQISSSYIVAGIAVVFPFVGIVVCVIGLCPEMEEDKKKDNKEETKDNKKL